MEIARERYICKWREAEEDSVDRPEYRAARKNLARARGAGIGPRKRLLCVCEPPKIATQSEPVSVESLRFP